MTRKELAKRFGRREKFSGVFKRFGSKTGFNGGLEKTVLLVDIKDTGDRTVSDHLWFACGKRFEAMNLQVGDVVEFYARVSNYMKGYVRESEYIDEREIDYRLSYPTKIRKLNTASMQPTEILEKFGDLDK